MSDFGFLLKGIAVGFSIAAPVGPIGMLCIRRTLSHGRLSGLFSGLGAAAADTIYGAIAALGISTISNFLISAQFSLRLIGGVFLFYLGIKTFLSKPPEKSAGVGKNSIVSDFLSSFFLTMTNPMTILAFVAVFAGLGLGEMGGHYLSAGTLIFGVFLGSAIWWLILSEGVTLFRKKISHSVLRWVNHIAGIIIAIFGILAILTLI